MSALCWLSRKKSQTLRSFRRPGRCHALAMSTADHALSASWPSMHLRAHLSPSLPVPSFLQLGPSTSAGVSTSLLLSCTADASKTTLVAPLFFNLCNSTLLRLCCTSVSCRRRAYRLFFTAFSALSGTAGEKHAHTQHTSFPTSSIAIDVVSGVMALASSALHRGYRYILPKSTSSIHTTELAYHPTSAATTILTHKAHSQDPSSLSHCLHISGRPHHTNRRC